MTIATLIRCIAERNTSSLVALSPGITATANATKSPVTTPVPNVATISSTVPRSMAPANRVSHVRASG